ncbi:hypothetical protein [Brucella tritici]|uniref:hypothetical protein n=1 Tax=Brucella tritici TaxID=94626 RepID=UPI002000B214|nr:hypothetical protein [Brucella tritici]
MKITENYEIKFTPGPWIAAQRYSSKVGLPVVSSTYGRSIASVTFFGLGEQFKSHDDESCANANLIASAPDLYDALIAADGLLRDLGHSLPQVKAAIAKAIGVATHPSGGDRYGE